MNFFLCRMYKTTTPRLLTRFLNRPIGRNRFYSDSKKEQIMKEFEIEDARMKMQKSTKFEQASESSNFIGGPH